MASPTQTAVGKDKSSPLIAEGLLKILEGDHQLRVKRSTSPSSLEGSSLHLSRDHFTGLHIQSVPDPMRPDSGLKTLEGVL